METREKIIEDIIENQQGDGELLTEFATVARDYQNNLQLGVNPDRTRNNPRYFKLYNSLSHGAADECARIYFLKPFLLKHSNDKKPWVFFNRSDRKKLVEFLESHRHGKKDTEGKMSNWQRAIALWNLEMGHIDDIEEAWDLTMENCDLSDHHGPLPIDLPMPNYMNLKYDPAEDEG